MFKYIKFLSIGLLVVCVVAFMQSHKSKLHRVFKSQKDLFEQITANGKPDVKACYIQKGEVLAIRQVIAHTKLQGITEDDQKAFYINAHNISIIAELNEQFPISSLEEESSFFDSKTFLVAGEEYTLKTLRIYILTHFKDARMHFCLYLGGLSSPKIPTAAFYHQNIDKELTDIARAFVNNQTHVKVKTRSKMVLLPEFMKWNMTDFGVNNQQGFIKYLNQYRSIDNKIPTNYTVDFYPYSWKM